LIYHTFSGKRGMGMDRNKMLIARLSGLR
jgi:hypothetical protein